MKKNLILLISLSVLLAGPATAQEQHRRPNDIKQYLEHHFEPQPNDEFKMEPD